MFYNIFSRFIVIGGGMSPKIEEHCYRKLNFTLRPKEDS